MGLFKNKKYIQGMKDCASPFKDILEEIADDKDDIQKLQKIFSSRKAKKLMKIYISDHHVKVKIIKDSKKEQISDVLRKALNQRKFDCSVSSYQDYQIKGRQGAHYVIFIDDPENIIDEKTKEVYRDNFGCKILKKNDMFFIIQNEQKHINQESFLKYYEETIEPIAENERLNQALRKKSVIDEDSKAMKYLNKISEDSDKNLSLAIMELIGFLTPLTFTLAMGEVTFHTIITELKKDKVDKEIIAEAQRQILLIKATDIMEKERYNLYKGQR